MSDIKERLDALKREIQKPEFLEGKGLSNEVNIHIFAYDASEEMTVRHFVQMLKAQCFPHRYYHHFHLEDRI